MDSDTQQRAIKGLITLWEDICFVQGKGLLVRQLKPHIEAALAEPGSLIHRLIEAMPDHAKWYVNWSHQPTETRRKLISKAFNQKIIRETVWLFHHLCLLARVHQCEGITVAEAERLIHKQYKDALSTITLKELLNKPSPDDVPKEIDMRALMSSLALFPGSLAGADKRLKTILCQRIRDFTGDTPVYEQDLKIALWGCAQGNGHLIKETTKMIEGDPPRPIEEQIALIARIFRGEEPKLMRTTLLRILRKTIEELPDIHQDKRRLETQNIELPLPDNIEALKAETPWTQTCELSEAEGRESIIEALARKGIEYEDLKPNQWAEIFERYALIRKGYEFSSKVGVSISSFYGKAAHAKEQKWSRIKGKIRKTSK